MARTDEVEARGGRSHRCRTGAMRGAAALLCIATLAGILNSCSAQATQPTHSTGATPATATCTTTAASGANGSASGAIPENIQVSHDGSVAHSEPMLVENPNNPLNLVGGSKFFSDTAHYLFKIGYFTSFDGGCTWTDGGLLPGY